MNSLKPLSSVYLISAWFALALLAFANAQEDFLADVRRLRLERKFDEAEQKIEELKSRLESKQFAQLIRLELEKMQCQTARTFERQMESRVDDYQQVIDSADQFMKQHSSNPNLILIEVQKAVTGLRFGELMRQEVEAGLSTRQKVAEAFSLLRNADKQLEALDKKLELKIPGSPRKTVNGVLTQRELISLQNQVRYQRAKSKIDRALLYGDEDPDNRIAVLTTARKELENVVPLIEKVDASWWDARLDLLMCLREVGDYRAARALIQSLPYSTAAPERKLAVRAEVIRLLLELRDLKGAEKIINEGRIVDGVEWADLDFAILEYYLSKKRASAANEQAALQDKLEKIVDAIESKHGTYWGRKANQYLVRNAKGTGAGGSAMLVRIAQDHYRRKEFEKSIELFEQAADAAKKELKRSLELELRFQAIVIHRSLRQHQLVVQKSRDVAKGFTESNRAAVVNLYGIHSAAELVRAGAMKVEKYVEMLDDHLARWKDHPSAGKVGLFRGNYDMAKKQYAAAALAYQQSVQSVISVDGALDLDLFEETMNALSGALRKIPEEGKDAKQLNAFRQEFKGPGFFEQVYRKTSGLESTLVGWATFALELDDQQLDRVWHLLQEENMPKGALFCAQLRMAVRKNDLDKVKKPAESFKQLGKEEQNQLLGGLARDWENGNSTVRNALANVFSQFSLSQTQRIENWELVTQAFILQGEKPQAIQLLNLVIEKQKENIVPQIRLAELLTESSNEKDLELALSYWRKIVSVSRPQSTDWYRAKYQIANCHYLLGRRQECRNILEVMKSIPPGWKDSSYADQFKELYGKCIPKQ